MGIEPTRPARYRVLLLDVARADAPSQTIGSVTLPDIGQPPDLFEVANRSDQIVASHQYVVRARLTHEGRLLFTTDRNYPVITAGNSTEEAFRAHCPGTR